MEPLKGVVVLDLTRVLAGPYSTMMLADFGADVIKLERPVTGDDSRAFGPYIGKESAYFMSLNRNKRSMTMNLKDPKHVAVFKEMVKKADVVVENYRPGTMEKLGVGYEVLKEINPKLIYAECSGFGATGPYAKKPAYDVIVQAMGGIMSITGDEGGHPTRVGSSVGDLTAGIFTAYGIMVALYNREKTGLGQKVDVAMLDCQVAILENAIARYMASGEIPKPIGNRHPSITPFSALTAKDGDVVVAVGNDKLWATFCGLIGRPELEKDPKFDTNPHRTENNKELYALLNEIFKEKTMDEWLEKLDAAGLPCTPINTIDRVMNDPQIKQREMIVEMQHPVAGAIKVPGIPVKMSGTPGQIKTPAPELGQDTKAVLNEMFGWDEAAIAENYGE